MCGIRELNVLELGMRLLVIRYQRLINTKKAIYQAVTNLERLLSLITYIFVNNPNSLGCKAFVFLRVKQN